MLTRQRIIEKDRPQLPATDYPRRAAGTCPSPAENFVFTFPVASEQPHLQSGLRDAPRVEMPGVSESK